MVVYDSHPLRRFELAAAVLQVAIFLSGCKAFGNLQAWPPPYSLPSGSSITINQELVVVPNAVSVAIQYGKAVDKSDVKLSHAHCRFELFTLQAERRTIYKDEVTIRKFVNSTDYVSKGFGMYASLAEVSQNGGAPMAAIYSTTIYLKSEKQPDLYRLICEHWEDPASGTYLTITQIQETLGTVATFHQTNE